MYLEYPSGKLAWADNNSEPFDLTVGQIVLVSTDPSWIEPAPDEAWVEEPWIGVVRLKLDDITILDANGRWRSIPTTEDVEYGEGSTVEVLDSSGIVRRLSKNPLKYLDLPALDDTAVEHFIVKHEQVELTFDDFGGLADIVERARELIELPLKHHEALAEINARAIKGVLFTGDPGTGKTMLARIIASNTDATFYHISGPEVFSKWYGQSEELLRLLFSHAAGQDRAIIFFDEIDSVAAQRDEDAHEASKRVVAQLLTLMDGFTAESNVVVIAATNRPDDIDVALRRPGRFDWEINFRTPSRADREAILRASARRLKVDSDLPHNLIAARTDGWSAAELAAIWTEAALLAVTDDRSIILLEDYVGGLERVEAQRGRIAAVPARRDRETT